MITVIIPAFNRASMITRTIESVLHQTHQNTQIIVIDDGSTDNTKESLQNYINRPDIDFQYYYKENGGCSTARNKGLNYAKGDYIAFLDSDDIWLPLTLEKLLNVLENTKADFVYSPSIEISQKGNRRSLKYPCAKNNPQNFAIEHFLTSNCRHGGILYRRKIFEKIKGFREDLKYNEDSDFLQRVALEFKAAYCPYAGFEYYHHKGNKSTNRVGIYSAMLTSYQDILINYPDFRQQLGEQADKHLKEIQIEQIKALIKNREFTEARNKEKMIIPYFDISLKLSLILQSDFPLLIQYLCYTIPLKAFNKLIYLIQGNKV